MNTENSTLEDKRNIKEVVYYWVKKVFLSALLSLFISFILACLLALVPNNQEKTKLPKRLLIEKINEELDRKELDSVKIDNNKIKIVVAKIIEDNYFERQQKEIVNSNSNFDLLYDSISREFNWYLFFLLLIIILGYSKSITWKDYLPVTSETKESGIHAKLNYQVIADRLSRKLVILMIAIVVFSIGFIFTIFKFSSEIDSIIHSDDIEAYETWINSIEFHVGKNNPKFKDTEGYYKLIETNTELFWKVYFTRFIIVRSFIALIVGSLITFLIKLYRRLREDRELIIQKEEALSAIHYIARGEWRFRYDSQGKLLFKGIDKKGKEMIINEEVFNKLTSHEKVKYIPLTLDILNNEDAKIETRELLGMIPIRELFRSSGDSKSNNREMLLNFEDTAQQLNQIKDDLKDILTRQK